MTGADSELAETQYWIETAFTCVYISVEARADLNQQCEDIGRMLGSMLAHPEKLSG